jgi:single-strand DNA-binding protein
MHLINHVFMGEFIMSYNRAIIQGNLGNDPELTEIGAKKTKKVRFSVATNESYTKADGEKVENVVWHTVVAFGRQAEVCDEYLSKGSSVLVEGRIDNRTWEDDDGNKRFTSEINAGPGGVQFLSTGNGAGGAKGGGGSKPAKTEEDDLDF